MFEVQRSKSKNNHIKQYICIGILMVVSIIAFQIRWLGIEHITADIETCLIPWSDSMRTGYGVRILSSYDGDYNMPYVTVLWLLNYLPGRTIIKVKLVSILFDYLGAIAAALVVSHFAATGKKLWYFAGAYSVVLMYPSGILNSAYWGQCDFIYVTFLLYMIYALLKEKPALAMLFLGCAFSFKLQAILALPMLLIYYWKRRSFSACYFLIVPLVMELLCLPAILGGCSVFVPFSVYQRQLGRYPYMYVFYPNFWAFFREAPYYIFSKASQFGVVAGLAVLAVAIIQKKKQITAKQWMGYLTWSVFFMMCFLPCMHERYGLFLEILLIIYCFLVPKCSLFAVVVGAGSYIAYLQVTFAKQILDDRWIAFAYLLTLGLFTYHLLGQERREVQQTDRINPERLFPLENKGIELINKHLYLLVGFCLTVAAVIIRKPMIECMSPDYLSNLIPIEENHHTALYMLLMNGMIWCNEQLPYLQSKTLFFLVKILVILSDLVVAGLLFYLVKGWTKQKEKALIIYAAVLFGPVSLMNGIIWGHLDGITMSICLCAILLSERKKWVFSGVLWGLAVCLQSHYLLWMLLVQGIRIYRNEITVKTLRYKETGIACITLAVISMLTGAIEGRGIITALIQILRWGTIETWMLYPGFVLLLILCMICKNWGIALVLCQLAMILDYGGYLYEQEVLGNKMTCLCYALTGIVTLLCILKQNVRGRRIGNN